MSYAYVATYRISSRGITVYIACRYDYNGEDYGDRRESFGAGGFCQPYHGAACSTYIGNELVFVRERFRLGQVQEKLRGTTELRPVSE